MRDYAKISPLFWVGDTGRRIRDAGKDCQVAALYLLSCPSANMIGLYYLPLSTMAHEAGLSKAACQRAMQRLSDLGFASWDAATETVFVTEMAAHQIGERLKVTDKRCKGVEREWMSLRHSPFHRLFYQRYAADFHLPKPSNARPSKGPSKPLRSQEQEQEHTLTSQEEHKQGGTEASELSTGNVVALAGRAGR